MGIRHGWRTSTLRRPSYPEGFARKEKHSGGITDSLFREICLLKKEDCALPRDLTERGFFILSECRFHTFARSERKEEPSNQRDDFGYEGSNNLSKSRKERKEAEAKHESEAAYLLSGQQDEIRA